MSSMASTRFGVAVAVVGLQIVVMAQLIERLVAAAAVDDDMEEVAFFLVGPKISNIKLFQMYV